MIVNTSDFVPAGLGISILVREEAKRDGSPIMAVYTRSELKDPGAAPGIMQNVKGNVTLATVGQKAPMLPIVFPSGAVAVAPALTHSIWSPMVDREGEPLNLPVKPTREVSA